MSNTHSAAVERQPTPKRDRIPLWIRRLAAPILLAWVAGIVVLNVIVPQLEVVGEMRTVSMSPDNAPSMVAMKRIGAVFEEFQSNSSVMIVLEGDRPLGDQDHEFYDRMVANLREDTDHVAHVQAVWGDPVPASGSPRADNRAAYVRVYLGGNQGESLANESVRAAQDIVADTGDKPEGLDVYVTGPAALSADQHIAGDRSMQMITAVTFLVITIMLLLVYRSLVTTVIVLATVALTLSAARGVVAFLGYHEIIGLSTFATNLLVTLAIAASTDYAIFLIGRYQEARTRGMERVTAFYDMYHGSGHVILGSGLTIAGATFCLHFTNLPYFRSLGIPLAIGMVTVVAAALTMGAAVVAIASRFRLLEPKRAMRVRGWRKVGAAITRWPGPILVATIGLSLIGLLTLPGYRTSYNDRQYFPDDLPANVGYAAADRHIQQARMNPELLMIETDHDMRNPSDFLVINKIAKAIFQVEGIGRVQAITRPLGTPIEHTSIPFQISMNGVTQQMNQTYQQDMMADMLKQADDIQTTIDTMEEMQSITTSMADTTHSMVTKMHSMVHDIEGMRDALADFDDFFRPIRNYFYWEPHCFDIPVCHALRSIFDALDGVDLMTEDFTDILPDMDRLDELMPQMVALMPRMISTMKNMKTYMLTMYQTQKGLQDQMNAMQENSTAMGKAFDESKNDDSFYLPPEAFDNPDFERAMKMFLSPDGHAVRFIISHEGDPMSPEGIKHIEPIKTAAKEAIKGTPLEGSTIYLAGTAATFKDMSEGSAIDLMIAGLASLALIFIIMLIITRAIVAAVVIVGTVAGSLGASFGLSVLFWQHILGIDLHWMVLAMSVIILLAVGADYNLLLVARFREEVYAGMKTGIIRAMGGTGSVVTAAGLVFAFTMMSMAVSELIVIGQVGTTIGLGLLFDTLVVRSFMTPSIAVLLGRWFWWPQKPWEFEPPPSPVPAEETETEQLPVGRS